MSNIKLIEEITEKIRLCIQNNQGVVDIENNLKSIVGSVITKLGLVSREEFEVQKMVLNATHKKLEELDRILKG